MKKKVLKKVLYVASNYNVDEDIYRIFNKISESLLKFDFYYMVGENDILPKNKCVPENPEIVKDMDYLFVWNGCLESGIGYKTIKKAEQYLIPTFYLERGFLPQEYSKKDWTFYVDKRGVEYNSSVRFWNPKSLAQEEKDKLHNKLKSLGIYNDKKDYVLLALQINGDIRITQQSPIFKDMQELINFVCGNVKKNVVVRKHPLDNIDYSLPSNAIWDTNEKLVDSIANAESVITINSSCGLWALAAKKPTIIFGNSLYENIAYKTNKENFLEAYKQAMKKPKDNIDSFLYRFLFNFQYDEKKIDYKRLRKIVKKPKVSVIVTNYNHNDYLDESIKSILAQKYKPLEIIVIDDGSDEDITSIVSKYPQIKFYKRPHYGLNNVRNFAILNMIGDIFMLHDADDVMFPERIKNSVYYFNKFPEIDVVYGNYIVTDKNLRDQHLHRNEDYNYNAQLLTQASIVPAGCMAVRKESFAKAGIFDARFSFVSDLEWVDRAYFSGLKFKFIDKPFIYYRRHKTSTGALNLNIQQKQEEIIMNRIREHAKQLEVQKRQRPTLKEYTDSKKAKIINILLDVWRSRFDLQEAFPRFPNDLGYKYRGKMTILEWARLHGVKEVPEIRNYYEENK